MSVHFKYVLYYENTKNKLSTNNILENKLSRSAAAIEKELAV